MWGSDMDTSPAWANEIRCLILAQEIDLPFEGFKAVFRAKTMTGRFICHSCNALGRGSSTTAVSSAA